MGPWLRVGRRLEWTLSLVIILGFVVIGFIQTRAAPSGEARLIVGIYSAFCIFPLLLLGLLAARWAKRKAAKAAPPITAPTRRRLLFYAILAVVMLAADRVWAEATGWNLSHILLGDVAILALLIAITEFQQWRKRHLPGS
jgi:hypothetical protein